MKTFSDAILRRQNPQSKIKIQLLSDLHLEVGQQYSSFTFPARAPFLLLGGDIGRLLDYDDYLKFLQSQASRFQKVFLVLGNHEFYGLDYCAGIEKAQQLANEPTLLDTVVLLNKVRWDDPNSALTIVGCTLWSDIPEDKRELVEAKINDFKKIKDWTSCRHRHVHATDVAWLREQVAKTAETSSLQGMKGQILVATHHAPCINGTSRPANASNPWTCAFATDLLDQPGWNDVQLWAFGHTHHSTDLMRNGIRLVANQRGYVLPGHPTQTDRTPHSFDPGMTVTL